MKNQANAKPLYEVYDDGTIHISVSKGNDKVGNIPQFSTLPGNDVLRFPDGRPVTNVVGTCGEHCKDCSESCYAVRLLKRFTRNVPNAWAKNTVLMRNDPEKVRREIKDYCNKNIVKYFRFHTSGELESTDHLDLYCKICNDNPDVTFYIYTKAFGIVRDYVVLLGNTIPENLIINLSEWHGNVERFLNEHDDDETLKFFETLNIFSYDDKDPEYSFPETLTHCPAIRPDGHESGVTCAQCRRCLRKGSKTAIYAH